MRIAFASSLPYPYTWGGSEELWWRVARGLLKNSDSVAAGVRIRPAKQLEELVAAGGLLHPYPEFKPGLSGKIRRALRKASLWPDWLDKFKPSLVIHSLSSHASGQDVSELFFKRGIPFVQIIQAASEFSWPDDVDIERMQKSYLAARANCFVSHSNWRLVEKQLAIDLPNGCVVRNPFNVRYDASLPWPAGSAGELRLACVGRIDGWMKGQDLLFEVLARPKWRERNVSLSLFGTGMNAKSFALQAKRLGLDRVQFRGHVSSVEGIWAEHHALALTSRVEGLPLAAVEAMLCARPCLVTDVAGNAELIRDNETGFVAQAPTTDFVDEALERLWTRRAELEAIGKRAAEHVRLEIPPDPVAAFTEKVYNWVKGQ